MSSSIATRSQTTQPDQTVTFDFDSNVASYVLGVAYWSFKFDSSDAHKVQSVTLDLSGNSQGSTVTCTVGGELNGHGNNTIDLDGSEVVVCCVASLTSDTDVTLDNTNGISNGGSSDSITLPDTSSGSSLSANQAFVSGFYLSYDENTTSVGVSGGGLSASTSSSSASSHKIGYFRTEVGTNVSNDQDYITGQVNMDNGKKEYAVDPTVNGGLIAMNTSMTGIEIQEPTDLVLGTSNQPVEFSSDLSSAAVLIQNLTIQTDSPTKVNQLGGGCQSWSISSNQVTLGDTTAQIYNGSEYYYGSVDFVIVGISD